jgi:RNA polymerase sigma-70 factor (ECF subfamily)
MLELYTRSGADGFGMSAEQFAALIDEVAAKSLPAAASQPARVEFCRILRLEELVLARACAAGNERAWEVFLLRYREKLYDIARQITREDSTGRRAGFAADLLRWSRIAGRLVANSAGARICQYLS